MKKWVRRMVDSRKRDVEAHLVLLALGALGLVVLALYHVVALRLPFDAAAYGEGLGWMLGGGGVAAAGQGMQRRSEKGGEDDMAQ